MEYAYSIIEVSYIELLSFRPEHMAKSLIDVIKKGKSGSVWVAENCEDPYEMEYLSRENIKKVGP